MIRPSLTIVHGIKAAELGSLHPLLLLIWLEALIKCVFLITKPLASTVSASARDLIRDSGSFPIRSAAVPDEEPYSSSGRNFRDAELMQ